MWKWMALPLCFCACQLQQPVAPSDGGVPDGGFGDGGTGSLSGPLAFDVHQSLEIHLLDGQGNVLGFGADLVDYDNTCAQLESHINPTQFQQVEVGVLGTQASPAPSAGSFQVLAQVTAGSAYVKWARLLPDAGVIGPFLAQDGTVTLTTSSADHLSGTFQVDIPDANGQVGQLSGTFDAPYCP